MVQQAVDRLLAALGVTGALPDLPEPPQVLHIFGPDAYVYAPEPGVFAPDTALGDEVRTGDLCGEVLFPEQPAREPVPIAFRGSGTVVCKRHPGRVAAGDCLAHLAASVYD